MATVEHLIVIEVIQDYEDGADPPAWWEALGLPPPWRWDHEAEKRLAAVRVLVEKRTR